MHFFIIIISWLYFVHIGRFKLTHNWKQKIPFSNKSSYNPQTCKFQRFFWKILYHAYNPSIKPVPCMKSYIQWCTRGRRVAHWRKWPQRPPAMLPQGLPVHTTSLPRSIPRTLKCHFQVSPEKSEVMAPEALEDLLGAGKNMCNISISQKPPKCDW